MHYKSNDWCLGCLLFLNQTDLSWFETQAACEDALGFTVEVLTAEQSIYLFEIAEATQLFSNASKWWIGLSDFTHEGTWTWSQSSTQADLSLYSEFFSPNSASHNTDDCVAMTITDRQLAWEDINCITNLEETFYQKKKILSLSHFLSIMTKIKVSGC